MFNNLKFKVMLYYSFIVRPANPSEKDSAKKIYAIAQSKQTLTIRDIAKHIAEHNSVFSEGTILGLLTDTGKCISENLKQGNRINLWDWGTFYVTLSSEGAENSEEFSTSLIKHVNLRWKTSKEMDTALQTVTYKRMPTIELQDVARKTMNQQANEDVGTTSGSSDDTGGSGAGDPGDVTP